MTKYHNGTNSIAGSQQQRTTSYTLSREEDGIAHLQTSFRRHHQTHSTTTVTSTNQIRMFYKRLKSSLKFNACLSASKPTSTAQLRHPPNLSKPNDRLSFYSYTPSVQQHESNSQPAGEIGQLPAYVVANPDHETDRESVTSNSSEISTGTLQNIRDQMANSLKRMRVLEDQVKQVPVLQHQLKQLRDEKKFLTEQLRNPEPSPIPAPQRVSPVSLEGLNVIKSGFNDVFLSQKPRKSQAPVPPSPRGSSVSSSTPYDESITSESPTNVHPTKRATRPPITRDIGVSTNQPIVHSRGTNSETRLYTKQELEAAIDLTIAKQTQARHKRSATVSTQFSPPVQPPKPTRSSYAQTHLPPSAASVATMTTPTIRVNASTSCRPATRTTCCSDDSVIEKPCAKCSVRTHSISVGPETQMDLTNSTHPSTALQHISLKSMDLPPTGKTPKKHPSVKTKTASTQVTPRPTLLATVGTQFTSSSQVHVACQHSPTKLDVQHKLTDTRGLVRYHHQSIGPEQSYEYIDQSTNTALPPFTVHRATNTLPPPPTVHTSTSPDSIQSRDIGSSTDSPSLPAPSKLPHIQFNCPFGCPNDGSYCDNCKDAIRSIAREVAFTSTTSLQKSSSSGSVTGASPVSEFSRIPRPTTLLSPRPERRFVRQTTYTITTQQNTQHRTVPNLPTPSSGAASEDDDEKTCPAEVFLRRLSQSTGADFSGSYQHRQQSPIAARRHQSVAPNNAAQQDASQSQQRVNASEDPCSEIESRLNLSESPPSHEDPNQMLERKNRTKVSPSREVSAALKVINDAIYKKQQNAKSKSSDVDFSVATQSASRVVQKEWFQVSSTDHSDPLDVEDYLDAFEGYSNLLLRYMVNMADTNGNTAMHYAVSHGNFDVVSILLDSKECDVNRTNNAGYTCVMLVSLAQLKEAAHHSVVKRLFQMSDVNIRAKKHSQTALMLAVSHGNMDMVKMLLGAGAGINIQDEDGSTALMCAAEHGRIDIVKLLLAHPDCDSTIHDVDGSTALKISLEAGHRDIGVLLYAHEHITRAKSSPYTSLRRKKDTNKAMVGNSNRGSRTSSGSTSMPSSPMSSRKFLPGDHHPPPRK